MGYLHYGADPQPLEIDDWTLAHLRVVVTTKLRRNESFTLTCRRPEDEAERRTSLWLQPAIPLRFEYSLDETQTLDTDYLHELAEAANTNSGILVEEAAEPVGPVDRELRPVA